MYEILMREDTRKLSHSQNFLKSSDFVGSLIDKSGISREDFVVEIGPGRGIITEELAKRAGRVIGVEYDGKLASDLKNRFSGYSNVKIVQGDFLTWDLPREPYKVFANIPFNMTADMINKLLSAQNPPEVTYLVMQDKAAERFIGQPVGPNTQASILLQPFYEVEVVTEIDRSQFKPRPSVDAVLAKFEKRKKLEVDPKDKQLYRDFVIYGFNQWQPTILEAFRKVFTNKQRETLARELSITGLKPSELTIDQWLGIFELFLNHVPQLKKEQVRDTEKRMKVKHIRRQKLHRTRAN